VVKNNAESGEIKTANHGLRNLKKKREKKKKQNDKFFKLDER